MSLKELHDDLLSYVKKGEFAQGIEKFYADDVTQQANADAVQSGMQNLAKAEYEYQGKVTSLDKVDVLARAIDDQGNDSGVVIYEVHMVWQHSEGGNVNVEQTVVERWENGKIKHIRFYGIFDSENA